MMPQAPFALDPIPPLVGSPLEVAPHTGTPFQDALALAPSPQWVRAYAAGAAVADSRRVQLLRGHRVVPEYAFPASDVEWDRLARLDDVVDHPVLGRLACWRLASGGPEVAAWQAMDPPSEVAALEEHVVLVWNAMDRWMVEGEEVEVHLRDPLHRVDTYASTRRVQVVAAGEVVADSRRPVLLFETALPVRYYLPAEDVMMDLLAPSPQVTRCAYKGAADHFGLKADPEASPVAWSYPAPRPEVAKVQGHIAFYQERVEALIVDGTEVPAPRTPWSRRA